MAVLQGITISTLLPLVVIANIAGGSTGLKYTVGDSIWSIPPTTNFYNNWSSSHAFHPGDTLLFEFEWEMYNVIQVTWAGYDSCTWDHPVKVFEDGPTIIELPREGVFYYICGISNYCKLGQRLIVTVNKTTSPAPAPPPPLPQPPK